jgi:hypothetical protein
MAVKRTKAHLLRIKGDTNMSKILNPIWTESNGLVSVIGSYKQNVDGQIHAIIRNRNDSSKAPYRTLCETYVSLHFINSEGAFTQNGHKLYIHSLPFRSVTCKKCLRIINASPPAKIPRPTETAEKRFFLVEYHNEELIKLTRLKDLKEEVKNHSDVIARIMVIDTYGVLYIKTVNVLVGEDGNEVTEEDL